MFQQATKKEAKAKIALFGPTGAGKTFTALRIATGIANKIGSKIAVIDTERGRASKYSNRFTFDVNTPETPDIQTMKTLIKDAVDNGYKVIIIDSGSHAWKELVKEMDALANAKYRGNTFTAWSQGTPKQEEFVNEILKADAHIIFTMRSKMQYEVQVGENGKTKPVKIGLAPIQGKEIEYEFDLLMEMDQSHTAFFSKDNTGKYQDQSIHLPGEELGEALLEWLSEGEKVEFKGTKKDLLAIGKEAGLTAKQVGAAVEKAGGFEQATWRELTDAVKAQATSVEEPVVVEATEPVAA
jgi:hypothetical protein